MVNGKLPVILKVVITSLFLLIILIADSAVGQEEPFIASVGDDGIQRVEILAGSYFYKPNHIVIKVNVPVEISIKKESGIVPHNIVVNELDAGIDINESISSEPKIIKFTPKKTGEYPFYCDKRLLFFKNHREKGMEGVFYVTDSKGGWINSAGKKAAQAKEWINKHKDDIVAGGKKLSDELKKVPAAIRKKIQDDLSAIKKAGEDFSRGFKTGSDDPQN